MSEQGSGPINTFVQIAMVAIIAIAAIVALTAGVPMSKGKPDYPDVAMGQEPVFRVEVFLVVFYAGLLVATPTYWGLVNGRFPTEISTTGTKFEAEAADSIDEARKLVKDLEEDMGSTERGLARAKLNIEQLATEARTTLKD